MPSLKALLIAIAIIGTPILGIIFPLFGLAIMLCLGIYFLSALIDKEFFDD